MSRLYNESKMSYDKPIDLETVGDMFAAKFIGRTSEETALMLGDAKGKMIYFDIIAKGSLTATEMPARKIVDLALRKNARTAFLGHNHPSGTALPSPGDLEATELLKDTLGAIGVELVDHFIVTSEDYVSLRESGMAGKIFYYDI